MTSEEDVPKSGITVHLIDSAKGHCVQSWSLAAKSLVTIGRADERDVVIVDPYVSRNHAELHYRAGQWWLVSKGRHGVLIDGRNVIEAPLDDGLVFRLGAAGPTLKFEDHPPGPRGSATLDFSSDQVVVLRMDKKAINEEVSQITGGDYFQKLQQRARALRDRRPD